MGCVCVTATSVPEMAEVIAENSETEYSAVNQVKCAVAKACPTSSAGQEKPLEVTEGGRSQALTRCTPWELGEVSMNFYTFLILATLVSQRQISQSA